jgi:2-polyprenyl-3-methyl-5-hydroxy-6-metoxy-1,4-benzoquinol methylase
MKYRQVLLEEYNSTAISPLVAINHDAYSARARGFEKRFETVLPKNKDAIILDIGCGPGFFLWFAQRKGYINSWGIDLSPEQVLVAQKNGIQNISLCGWKDYLPERLSRFDLIILDNVIEHLNKDEIVELLKLIYVSLKPGGALYISTPNAGSILGLPLAFIDFTHEVYFSASSLRQVLQACGFDSVCVDGESILAFDLRSAIRSILFKALKPLFKAIYIIGTGGGGRTSIPHVIEPSLFAIAKKALNS